MRSLIKLAIPTGLAVLSHEALIGIVKFAKVGSAGALELIVPCCVFIGAIALINRCKKSLKSKPQQLYIAPPNYEEHYNNLNNNQQPNYQE
jgi:hypothetical protein